MGSKLKERPEETAPGFTLELEQVRTRAYEIFMARAGAPGDAIGDWLQAERELTAAAKRPEGVKGRSPSTGGRSQSRGRDRVASEHGEWDLEPLEALIERRRRARLLQVL